MINSPLGRKTSIDDLEQLQVRAAGRGRGDVRQVRGLWGSCPHLRQEPRKVLAGHHGRGSVSCVDKQMNYRRQEEKLRTQNPILLVLHVPTRVPLHLRGISATWVRCSPWFFQLLSWVESPWGHSLLQSAGRSFILPAFSLKCWPCALAALGTEDPKEKEFLHCHRIHSLEGETDVKAHN